ncbi:hypothetical protein MRX96_043613 [Rhipicephalus microplus]
MSPIRRRRANTTLKVKPSLRRGSTCHLQSSCVFCGKSRESYLKKKCGHQCGVRRDITWALPSEASSSWSPPSRGHAIIFVSPAELTTFFASRQVGGNIEDRADGVSQLHEASQGSDLAGCLRDGA